MPTVYACSGVVLGEVPMPWAWFGVQGGAPVLKGV